MKSFTEHDTEILARKLALVLRVGDCVGLVGDLGAGKTVFTRAIIQALAGSAVEVTSPTFALMQPYETPRGSVWHCDFYRLEQVDDVHALGLDDVLENSITLIEWPEIAANLLPDSRLTIKVGYGASEGEREIVFEGDDDWQQRLTKIR